MNYNQIKNTENFFFIIRYTVLIILNIIQLYISSGFLVVLGRTPDPSSYSLLSLINVAIVGVNAIELVILIIFTLRRGINLILSGKTGISYNSRELHSKSEYKNFNKKYIWFLVIKILVIPISSFPPLMIVLPVIGIFDILFFILILTSKGSIFEDLGEKVEELSEKEKIIDAFLQGN